MAVEALEGAVAEIEGDGRERDVLALEAFLRSPQARRAELPAEVGAERRQGPLESARRRTKLACRQGQIGADEVSVEELAQVFQNGVGRAFAGSGGRGETWLHFISPSGVAGLLKHLLVVSPG